MTLPLHLGRFPLFPTPVMLAVARCVSKFTRDCGRSRAQPGRKAEQARGPSALTLPPPPVHHVGGTRNYVTYGYYWTTRFAGSCLAPRT